MWRDGWQADSGNKGGNSASFDEALLCRMETGSGFIRPLFSALLGFPATGDHHIERSVL